MPQLSTRLPWEIASNKWPATINPVLALPMLQGVQVTVTLQTGSNEIVHGLGRVPVAWPIQDQTAAAEIYRSGPFSEKTLTLTSSASATVTLWVY